MSASIVQLSAEVQDGGVSTSNVTFGSSTTTSNDIIVQGGVWRSGGGDITNVTDNKSNTFSNAVYSGLGNQGRAEIWYCLGAAGGASHQITVTYSGAGSYGAWGAIEASGLIALDTISTVNGNTGNTAVDDANVAATSEMASAYGLAVCVNYLSMSSSNVNFSSAPTTGWTAHFTENDANSYGGVQPAYKILSAVATESAAWSHDNSAGGWAGALATFTADAPGGTNYDIALNDSFQVSDSLLSEMASRLLSVLLSDALPVSESVQIDILSGTAIINDISITDNIRVYDANTISRTFENILLEIISLSESFGKDTLKIIARTLLSNLSLLDSLASSKVQIIQKLLSDSLLVDDSVAIQTTANRIVAVLLSDYILTSDELFKQSTASQLVSILLQDNVSVSDSVVRSLYNQELYNTENPLRTYSDSNILQGIGSFAYSFSAASTPVYGSNYSVSIDANGLPTADSRVWIDLLTEAPFLVDGDRCIVRLAIAHNGTASNDGKWSAYLDSQDDALSGSAVLIKDVVYTSTDFDEFWFEFVYSSGHRYLVVRENNADNDGGVYIDQLSLKLFDNVVFERLIADSISLSDIIVTVKSGILTVTLTDNIPISDSVIIEKVGQAFIEVLLSDYIGIDDSLVASITRYLISIGVIRVDVVRMPIFTSVDSKGDLQ